MKCEVNIVEYLTKKGVLPSVSSSSVLINAFAPENALDYSLDSIFHTDYWTTSNQWWEIDFKQQVLLSSYSITTESKCNYVTNWTIHVSNGQQTFIKVDERSGYFPTGELNNLNISCKIRFLRIYGNTPNCKEDPSFINYLAFHYVKFYGCIFSTNICTYKCKKSNIVLLSIISFLMLS